MSARADTPVVRELVLVFRFRTEADAYRRRMDSMFRGFGWASEMLDPKRVRLRGLMAGEALALAREAENYGGQVDLTPQPKKEDPCST